MFEAKVNKWISSLKRSNLEDVFRRTVLENQEEILDLNTAQLEKGIDSFGRFLEEYASEDYAQFKKSIGSQAPLGIPNLFLEGDFYAGFILRYDGQAFIFTSTDEKKDELVTKYGSDLFGLTLESQTEITPDLILTFIRIFRNGML